MKKNYFNLTSLVFAGLPIAFSACTNEPAILIKQVESNAPVIYASQELQAKSSITVDGEGVGTIYWSPADDISIFYGASTPVLYTSTNIAPETTAAFTTSAIIGSTELASTNIWGLYPHNPSAVCDGSSISTTLPSTQYGVSGTFDDDLFMTVAHSDNTNLHFYNVCGGIKFSLSRDDITSITFAGNNNEDIAGDITVSFVEGLPSVSVDSGEKTITVTPKGGGTFASDTYYYIVVLPQTLSNGFTMTFETGTQLGTFEYNAKAVTIKRSVFGKKDDIDGYATFVANLPSNIIRYTTTDGNIIGHLYTQYFNANVVSNTYENGEGTITFDAPLTEIGSNPFYTYGNTLQTITLPSSIVSINSYAFYNTPALTRFYGPLAGPDNRSLIIDGKLIHVATSGITSYIIPSEVKIIGRDAFWTSSDKKVTSIAIPEGVEVIEQDGFYGTSVTGIILPSTIKELGQSWYGDADIESVSFPAGVTSIGKWGASKSVVEFNSMVPPSLGVDALGTSENAVYVPSGSLETYKAAWPEYASRLREKTSSQPLNEIWYTTNDGKPARSDRSNPNIVPSWKQNIISNKDGKIVFDAPLTRIPYDAFENSNLITVSLPDAMFYLGNNSFQLSTSLQEVRLGKYLTQMTWASFNECTALTSINIPEYVSRIEGMMFYQCRSLSSIVIPASVSRIDGQSFYGCSGLTSITSLASTPPTGGSGMFDNTNDCPIYVPEEAVEAYKTATYWSNYEDRIQAIH